ncbi:MAG: ATP synthase F1 subunit delta [Oscillochloris sp.]|nr:ATP synthase F1 subunit delta [Oscillochloris sp.]
MATTADTKAIARTLYDALLHAAIMQLQAAAPRLNGVAVSAEQIDAALPADALPQVRNFIRTLAGEGLLGDLSEIVAALDAYHSGGEQAIDALVTSAVPLTAEQRAKIVGDLKQRYGELDVRFTEDGSLIGGLIIRVGDQVLDNSLRTRLGAVQRNMLAS